MFYGNDSIFWDTRKIVFLSSSLKVNEITTRSMLDTCRPMMKLQSRRYCCHNTLSQTMARCHSCCSSIKILATNFHATRVLLSVRCKVADSSLRHNHKSPWLWVHIRIFHLSTLLTFYLHRGGKNERTMVGVMKRNIILSIRERGIKYNNYNYTFFTVSWYLSSNS